MLLCMAKGSKVAIELKLFTITLDYPGKHNIITSVLQSQRGRQKTIRGRQDYGRKIRQMLISEKKQATSQRMYADPKKWKRQENRSFPTASRKRYSTADTLILAQACLSQTSRSVK